MVYHLARWMALAYRTPMTAAERLEVAFGEGPESISFSEDTLHSEIEDLRQLEELGIRVLALPDDAYPKRLRVVDDPPLLLYVAGREGLLDDDEVRFVAGPRAEVGNALQEAIESGTRAVILLSKGMLRARTELRGLHDAIQDGNVTLVSAEPPRASWGPMRTRRSAELVEILARRSGGP